MRIYLLILFLPLSYLSAYNKGYGPFRAKFVPETIALTKIPVAKSQGVAHDFEHYYNLGDQGNAYRIKLKFNYESHYTLYISRDQQSLVKGITVSEYGTVSESSLYSANLNDDNIPDFIIYVYSGGCGLASGHCDVTFLLSNDEGYSATTVDTYFPGDSNFVKINGKKSFIHAYFSGTDKCLDGKAHNFWIYNILEFGEQNLSIRNKLDEEFPKVIWYSFRENHDETTLLTASQKSELWDKSAKFITRR